ncbi:FkbM family methyltransferase [Caulobacter sp. SLTY]|uniref:FkbM family methyltransferase n=1 Tax=Caulobacter sp. SLTY TaxID=2683262 RepID=UPI001412F771|nr:FkbM family methyltransferase [Caulobacter sp. SLTY]NBB16042.1 FkbM family methyltransferase [Caulobacter sp. SLTY]
MASMIRSAVSIVPWRLRGAIRSMPGIAQAQRWLLDRTLNGAEFEHLVDAGPAKGVRFWIRMPDDKGIWTGTYEQSFAERIAAATPKGGVAFDIGGWHGFFTGVMAAQGASKVVVFEPLPDNIERLRKLVALNPKLPIQLNEMALGEEEGETTLVIMPDTSMAKLANSDFQPDAHGQTRITVRIASIDGLVSSGALPPPQLMKLDVEGAEMMVLRGADTVLRTHKPIIFSEVHSSALLAEVRPFLEERGYKVTLIDEDPAAAARRDVFQIQAKAG